MIKISGLIIGLATTLVAVLAQTHLSVAQCVGSVSTINIPRNIGCSFGTGGNAEWDGPVGGIISDPGGTASDFTVTWTAVGTFRLKRTFPSGCTGTPLYSTYFTTSPQPPTPLAGEVNQQPGCGQVTLSYTGSSYAAYWQTSDNGTLETYRITREVTTSGTYYLRIKDGDGCWSGARSIVVSSIPSAPIGGTLGGGGNYFYGSVARTLNLSNHSGTIKEYRYQENGGPDVVVPSSNSSVQVSFSNSTNASLTRTYWAVVQLNGCEVNSSSASITINPLPSATLTACVGQTTALSIPRSIGCQYGAGSNAIFALNTGGIINDPGGSASSFDVTWTAPGVYTLKRTFPEGCGAELISATVEVFALPQSPSSSPLIVSNCGNILLGFVGSPPTGTEWHWQENDSNGYHVNSESQYEVEMPGTYYLRSRTVQGECWSDGSSAKTISVRDFNWLEIPAVDYDCSADPSSLTLVTDNESDRWFTVSTGGIPLSQSNSITIANSPSVLYIERTVPGCNSRTPFEIDFAFQLKCNGAVNSIKVSNPVVPASDITSLVDLIERIDFFDGIGRPIQRVAIKNSPDMKDIVIPVIYDKNGREVFNFLPYVSQSGDGVFKPEPVGGTSYSSSPHYNFYTNANDRVSRDSKPFSISVIEQSPLGRIIKQGSPGEVWQPDGNNDYTSSDATVKMSYDFNGLDEVVRWTYVYPSAEFAMGSIRSGDGVEKEYYGTNDLHKNKTKDENGNEVIEYLDSDGKVLLKRVQVTDNTFPVNDSNYASTYYIYDDFGNLVMVLPPEAVKALIGQ